MIFNKLTIASGALIVISVFSAFFSYWLLSGNYKPKERPRIILKIDSIGTRVGRNTIEYKATTRNLNNNSVENEIIKTSSGQKPPTVGQKINYYDHNESEATLLGFLMAALSVFIGYFVYSYYKHF